MSNEVKNDTKVLKSKRFVVRMSLVGKNQVIEFTSKKVMYILITTIKYMK